MCQTPRVPVCSHQPPSPAAHTSAVRQPPIRLPQGVHRLRELRDFSSNGEARESRHMVRATGAAPTGGAPLAIGPKEEEREEARRELRQPSDRDEPPPPPRPPPSVARGKSSLIRAVLGQNTPTKPTLCEAH